MTGFNVASRIGARFLANPARLYRGSSCFFTVLLNKTGASFQFNSGAKND